MRIEDLHQVWIWRNQWRVRQYMFNQSEIDFKEHLAWYESAAVDPLKHLLIFEVEGKAAGFVSFSESASGRIADWGFHTAPGSPKGYGRLLGSAALLYGFKELGLHKVCGRVLDHNEASIRLHQRLGFKLEGVVRDGYHDGLDYHSVHHYGIFDFPC